MVAAREGTGMTDSSFPYTTARAKQDWYQEGAASSICSVHNRQRDGVSLTEGNVSGDGHAKSETLGTTLGGHPMSD